MSADDARDRFEQVEALLHDLREDNQTTPILVEGEKDEAALRNLDFRGPIIKVNTGATIFNLCEAIARKHREVIILMDWDRTGGKLTRLLREGLDANQVKANAQYRRDLARATRKEITDVESMDTYVYRMRNTYPGTNGGFKHPGERRASGGP